MILKSALFIQKIGIAGCFVKLANTKFHKHPFSGSRAVKRMRTKRQDLMGIVRDTTE
jgi:hypothetical protein